MYKTFYTWMMLLSGAVLLIYSLFAGYESARPEWMGYQKEYKEQLIERTKDDKLREKAKTLKLEIQQIYLDSLERVDRCTNCHLGVENPLMAGAELPLKQHSGDYLEFHPVDRYGCTICHNGQGRATNKKEAHGVGHETHWDKPITPFDFIQSSCASCHDLEMLMSIGVDKIVRGERLFRDRGCKGCHKLDGVGGVLGDSLDGVGSQPAAHFPMKYIEGEKTLYTWLKEYFDDPRNIVLESEILANLSDEESDLLTTYVLSLKSDEAPREYRRIREARDLEETWNDGEALYKMYCVACHLTGKDSIYDEVFKRTIPAIMNPSFLKAADDRLLKMLISEGRAGTPMTSWKTSAAGIPDEGIDKIIEYVTRDRPAGEKPEAFEFARYNGDVEYGEELFRVRCVSCHGGKGEGGVGLNLRNPLVQKEIDPAFLAVTVRDGREGTHMAAFGKEGVGLPDQNIVDLITYIRTLSSKEVGDG